MANYLSLILTNNLVAFLEASKIFKNIFDPLFLLIPCENHAPDLVADREHTNLKILFAK